MRDGDDRGRRRRSPPRAGRGRACRRFRRCRGRRGRVGAGATGGRVGRYPGARRSASGRARGGVWPPIGSGQRIVWTSFAGARAWSRSGPRRGAGGCRGRGPRRRCSRPSGTVRGAGSASARPSGRAGRCRPSVPPPALSGTMSSARPSGCSPLLGVDVAHRVAVGDEDLIALASQRMSVSSRRSTSRPGSRGWRRTCRRRSVSQRSG